MEERRREIKGNPSEEMEAESEREGEERSEGKVAGGQGPRGSRSRGWWLPAREAQGESAQGQRKMGSQSGGPQQRDVKVGRIKE